MKTKFSKTANALLFVAGALLIVVGAFIIMAPVDFYASSDIAVGSSASLLNELKAPAGLLLAAGVFMLSAIFVRHKADTALSLAALIYLSYAFSRLMSIVFDGVPAAALVQAAVLEALIGIACVAVLMLRRIPARRGA